MIMKLNNTFLRWVVSTVQVLQQLKDKALKRAEMVEDDILRLIEERAQARKNKDFARSDHIRAELSALGIALMDVGKDTIWRPCVPVELELAPPPPTAEQNKATPPSVEQKPTEQQVAQPLAVEQNNKAVQERTVEVAQPHEAGKKVTVPVWCIFFVDGKDGWDFTFLAIFKHFLSAINAESWKILKSSLVVAYRYKVCNFIYT